MTAMRGNGSAVADIPDLLRRGFLSMAFQPIYGSASSTITGFEALLRGPRGTPLANPGTLFGSASPLPRAMLHQLDLACVRASLRTGRLLPPGCAIFVNLHGETLWRLRHESHDLFHLLESVGVDPHRVVLEVAETTEKEHVRAIQRSLLPFRKLGVRVALDDVGVRYPWLHHLLHLEPEYLKIDRGFVTRAWGDPRRVAVLHGLLALARHAGASVVAEGVECWRDWRMLVELGVELAQGYWLGRPGAAGDWRTASGRPLQPADEAPSVLGHAAANATRRSRARSTAAPLTCTANSGAEARDVSDGHL